MPSGPVSPESEADEVDLAVAAYHDDGDWRVEELRETALESLDSIARELRRFPGDGAFALMSVGEDFFLVVRPRGADLTVLLSDVSAATDWSLARAVVDHLGVPVEDDDEPAPGGDLGLLADLGFPARDMGLLLDEQELYPDEQLSDIATKLGFGPEFDDLAGLTTA